MDLPSLREIELETLLRERDAQVTELTDEVSHLRHYLPNQPGPSVTDPVSLPPALLAILQPHINGPPSTASPDAAAGSASITAALLQRARLLQNENDELYDLLKLSETGKLKDEVRGLRRVISRMERALKESHEVIASLSVELEKSHDTILARNSTYQDSYSNSRSPQMNSSNAYQNSRPIPTGPRAHKKQRLSESQLSPARSTTSLPNSAPNANTHSLPNNPTRSRRDRSPRPNKESRKVQAKRGENDEDKRTRSRSPRAQRPREVEGERTRNRERPRGRRGDRGKEYDRAREMDVDRDRDKDRGDDKRRERERDRSRRNGVDQGGGGGGGGERGSRGNASYGNGDRTLAERMGLGKAS